MCRINPSFLLSMSYLSLSFSFFFFNDTATTEIYTLSLHDALPISFSLKAADCWPLWALQPFWRGSINAGAKAGIGLGRRSEEHTSELQSLAYLVCRLLLEKKKNNTLRPFDNIDDEKRSEQAHASVR